MARAPIGYHSYPEVQQLHRAIGGYTTSFSELIASMRHTIEAFLSPSDKELGQGDPLLRVLFVSMTAKPISDAFFAMAGAVAELDDHGEAIRKALRRSVSDQITFRNDVAHADWSLGWEVVDTGERVPDTAFKIKSVDGELKVVNLDMGTNTVIANINLLLELTESIRVFGRACRDIQCGRDQTLLQDLEVIASSSPGPARVRRIKSDGP